MKSHAEYIAFQQLKATLLEMNIPKERIHFEQFT